jgi:hypothetical protein
MWVLSFCGEGELLKDSKGGFLLFLDQDLFSTFGGDLCSMWITMDILPKKGSVLRFSLAGFLLP